MRDRAGAERQAGGKPCDLRRGAEGLPDHRAPKRAAIGKAAVIGLARAGMVAAAYAKRIAEGIEPLWAGPKGKGAERGLQDEQTGCDKRNPQPRAS